MPKPDLEQAKDLMIRLGSRIDAFEKRNPCWKGYEAVGMKNKDGKQVPNCVPVKDDSPAWTREEGKDPKGGLNAKGRASAKKEGHDLKPPAPHPKTEEGKARRKSFCARMSGMPGPMKDEKGRPTRKALSLKAWNC